MSKKNKKLEKKKNKKKAKKNIIEIPKSELIEDVWWKNTIVGVLAHPMNINKNNEKK